jgi:hypothetical protein
MHKSPHNNKRAFSRAILTRLSLFLIAATAPLHADVILTPTDDTDMHQYVSVEELGITEWEHTFLRFDVSGLTTTSQATLRIYQSGYHSPNMVYVGAVENDNWNENDLSTLPARTIINNAPELQLDSVAINVEGYVELVSGGVKMA